jgi:glycosyltransferase involved in cell wall biosynthesis
MNSITIPSIIIDQIWDNDVLPTVTISCSTYNHEEFIRDAIEGFLMQKTTFKVKIWIHDDASTDNTANIIREYEKEHPQLFVVTCQVENQYKRNPKTPKYIKPPKQRGKYIAKCEGDDYWTDPLKLQKQVDFLEANPGYSMCFHNAEVVVTNEEFAFKNKLYKHLTDKDYSGTELLERWTIPTASVVYRRKFQDLIKQKPKHPDYMYGDIVLFLSLAEYGKIRCINQKMSVYRVHDGGLSNASHTGKRLQYIKHQLAIQNSFGGKYKYVTHAIIAKFYLQIAFAHFYKREFAAGFKNLKNCMFYILQGVVFAPMSFFRMIIKNVIWKQ